MADPFIGEIDFFPYNFAPENYLLCQGQSVSVAQYQALYSLIANIYGGTYNVNFNLPNLVGTAMVGVGQAPAPNQLNWTLGKGNGGTETVTLNASQYPGHNHTLGIYALAVNQTAPAAGYALGGTTPGENFAAPAANANTTMHPSTLTGFPGGGQAHENRQPFLVLMPCIALSGVYPNFNS